jgi:hypothetical protein
VARRKTFTRAREPIELEAGGEVFTAPAIIAPVVLGELLDKQEQIANIYADKTLTQRQTMDAILKAVDELMALILVPDSAQRFHARLFSRDEPLDLQYEVMPMLEYLTEEYTDRPTSPSPSSTPSLTTSDGQPSTDGVPNGVSTLSTSTVAASAT